MKLLLSFIGALFLFTAASCGNKVKTAITGWWTIDSANYIGYSIRPCFLSNIIFFEEDGTSKLPFTENLCAGIETYVEKGSWTTSSMHNAPVVLNVDSKNRLFNHSFRVKFHNDAVNHLFKMELISDSMYILCKKGVDANYTLSAANEMVEMTKDVR